MYVISTVGYRCVLHINKTRILGVKTVQFNMCNLSDSCSHNASAFNWTFMDNESLSSDSNYTDFPHSDVFKAVLRVYPFGKFVTCSLAIVTNLLVVATIISCYKFWKYSTGLLLLTLGCIDICGCLIQIVFTSLMWFDPEGIIVIQYVCTTLTSVSNFQMLLISLNRYALVCTPFSHYRITSRNSVIRQILTISAILLCFNLYLIFFDKASNPEETFSICIIIIYVIISHIIPLVASSILTFLVVCEFSKNTSHVADSRNTRPASCGERNITKAMIVVNLAFIIFTLPHIVSFTLTEINAPLSLLTFVNSYRLENNDFIGNQIAFLILFIVRDINYSVNILIYSAYIPRFRTALLGLFRCKFGSITGQNSEK